MKKCFIFVMDQAAAWTIPVVVTTGFLFYIGSYLFIANPYLRFFEFVMLFKPGCNNPFNTFYIHVLFKENY